MSKRKKVLFIVAGLAVLVLSGLWVLGTYVGGSEQEQGPVIDGDPMWLWIAQLRYDDPEARRDALEGLRKIGPPALAALAADAKSPNERVRTSSAWALKRLDQAGLPKLLEALKQGDLPARQEAAEALGDLGNREAVPALLAAMSDHYKVKEAAIRSLIALKDERAGQAFSKELTDSIANQHGWVHESLIQPVVATGDKSAVPRLVALLKQEDRSVRLGAVEALARVQGRSAVRELIPMLDDGDSGVRLETVKELGEMGDPAAIPRIVAAFGDKDKHVRFAAIMAAAKLRAPQALPELVRMLDDESSRNYVIKALGSLGDRGAVPSLTKLAANSTLPSFQREHIAEVLAQIGDQGAVPILIEIMRKDPYRFPDSDVCKVLGRVADPATLVKLFDSKEGAVRYGALAALGHAGHAQAFQLFEKVFENGRAFPELDEKEGIASDFPQAAVSRLADMGPHAVPTIVYALTHARKTALPVLAEWKREGGKTWLEMAMAAPAYAAPYLAALTKAASDANADVRWAAISSLGSTGRKEAVPVLAKAVGEKWPICEAAVLGLCRVQHRSAYRALLNAAENGDGRAADILGALGDMHAVPVLMKSLKTPDGQLLLNAETALEKITGQHFEGSFGQRYDKWQKWWKANKKGAR